MILHIIIDLTYFYIHVQLTVQTMSALGRLVILNPYRSGNEHRQVLLNGRSPESGTDCSLQTLPKAYSAWGGVGGL